MKIFQPNKVLSKSSMLILMYSQLAILVIFWCFSSSTFLPTPQEILLSISSLWYSGIGNELIISYNLNLEAILYSTIISLLLAYLTTIPFFRPPVKFLSRLRFLSMVGLTFLFTLTTKSTHALKLSLLVFSMSVFFVTSILDILESIPKFQFDLARTLKMGNLRIVWEIVVLGQIDKIFDSLRQNAAMSWMMISFVEGMNRSEGGIGAMLMNANKHFHLADIMAIQIIILITGLGQDYIIGLLKSVFCPYASLGLERK